MTREEIRKNIKQVKRTVFVFNCPLCDKQITSLYRLQLEQQAKAHMNKHKEEDGINAED